MLVSGIGGQQIKLWYYDDDYSVLGRGRTMYDVVMSGHKNIGKKGLSKAEAQDKYFEGFRKGFLEDDFLVYESNSLNPKAKGKGIKDISTYEPLVKMAEKNRETFLKKKVNDTVYFQQQAKSVELEEIIKNVNSTEEEKANAAQELGTDTHRKAITKEIKKIFDVNKTSLTLTDKFIIASRKNIAKLGADKSIEHIQDLRNTPIPKNELHSGNYKLSNFMTLPDHLPKGKALAEIYEDATREAHKRADDYNTQQLTITNAKSKLETFINEFMEQQKVAHDKLTDLKDEATFLPNDNNILNEIKETESGLYDIEKKLTDARKTYGKLDNEQISLETDRMEEEKEDNIKSMSDMFAKLRNVQQIIVIKNKDYPNMDPLDFFKNVILAQNNTGVLKEQLKGDGTLNMSRKYGLVAKGLGVDPKEVTKYINSRLKNILDDHVNTLDPDYAPNDASDDDELIDLFDHSSNEKLDNDDIELVDLYKKKAEKEEAEKKAAGKAKKDGKKKDKSLTEEETMKSIHDLFNTSTVDEIIKTYKKFDKNLTSEELLHNILQGETDVNVLQSWYVYDQETGTAWLTPGTKYTKLVEELGVESNGRVRTIIFRIQKLKKLNKSKK